MKNLSILASELAYALEMGRVVYVADAIEQIEQEDAHSGRAAALVALTMHEAAKDGDNGIERARALANYLYVRYSTGGSGV